MGIVLYEGEECYLRVGKYGNGNMSLYFVSIEGDRVLREVSYEVGEVLRVGEVALGNSMTVMDVKGKLVGGGIIGSEILRVVMDGNIVVPIYGVGVGLSRYLCGN